MKAGHSAKSQKPADLLRNHLPACSGLGCRLAPEWGADLERILHWEEFTDYTKNKQIKASNISPIFSEDPENVLVKVRHTLAQELKKE